MYRRRWPYDAGVRTWRTVRTLLSYDRGPGPRRSDRSGPIICSENRVRLPVAAGERLAESAIVPLGIGCVRRFQTAQRARGQGIG